MSLDQDASAVSRLGVLARLVEGAERGPELPAVGLVRLSRGAAERDDRRPGLLGERRSLHSRGGRRRGCRRARPPGRRRARTRRAPAERGRAPRRVSSDSSCSLMIRSPASRAVHALTPKAVMPKWCRTGRYGLAPVVQLVDLVEVRDRVTTHGTPFTSSSLAAISASPGRAQDSALRRAHLSCGALETGLERPSRVLHRERGARPDRRGLDARFLRRGDRADGSRAQRDRDAHREAACRRRGPR